MHTTKVSSALQFACRIFVSQPKPYPHPDTSSPARQEFEHHHAYVPLMKWSVSADKFMLCLIYYNTDFTYVSISYSFEQLLHKNTYFSIATHQWPS